MSDVIAVERDGHVATLWLDNPDRRNAMGRAFFDGVRSAIEELSDDADVRAIVISARGPAFTVGLDLKEMTAGDLTSAGAGGGSEASRRLAGYRSLSAGSRRSPRSPTAPSP